MRKESRKNNFYLKVITNIILVLGTTLFLGACANDTGSTDNTSNTEDTSQTSDTTAPTVDVAWAELDNTQATIWTGSASLDETGTGYCAAVPTGSAAPSSSQVKAGNGGGIVGSGSVTMTTAANTYGCTVTTLTELTTYDFYFVAKDDATTANLMANPDGPVVATTQALPLVPDVTPPTIDVAWTQANNTTGITWTGNASLDEAGTGYCVAVPNGSAAPNVAQVKAGTGGAIVGTGGSKLMAVAATTYNCLVTNLTESTAYDFYFVAEDIAATPNLMANPVGPIGATTPDVTAPTTDVAWSEVNFTETSWRGHASLNEPGTGYCVAVPSGSAAPSAAQVKAGTGGAIVGTGGSKLMSVAATTYNCLVTNLSGSTAYDFYFVAEDIAATPNLMVNPIGPIGGLTSDDLTPPTIDVAWAQVDNTAGTSWTGSASSSEPGTGYCVAVWSGAAAPSAAQVKAGVGGSFVGTRGTIAMPVAANTYNCVVTNLINPFPYDFYFVAEDIAATPNLMVTPVGPVNATTPDLTAPNTIYWMEVSLTTTSWTGQTALDEAGTGYCAAVPSGSPAPSAAQIKAGTGGGIVGTGGSKAMPDTSASYNCTVTNLTNSTTYDIYFVAEDTVATPNLQASPSKVTTTTAYALVTFTGQLLYADTSAGVPNTHLRFSDDIHAPIDTFTDGGGFFAASLYTTPNHTVELVGEGWITTLNTLTLNPADPDIKLFQFDPVNPSGYVLFAGNEPVTTTYYTSCAAWATAATGEVNGSGGLPSSGSHFSGSFFTMSSFETFSGNASSTGFTSGGWGGTITSNVLLYDNVNSVILTFDGAPAYQTALCFKMEPWNGVTYGASVTLSDGSSSSQFSRNGATEFGFISTGQITSMTIGCTTGNCSGIAIGDIQHVPN